MTPRIQILISVDRQSSHNLLLPLAWKLIKRSTKMFATIIYFQSCAKISFISAFGVRLVRCHRHYSRAQGARATREDFNSARFLTISLPAATAADANARLCGGLPSVLARARARAYYILIRSSSGQQIIVPVFKYKIRTCHLYPTSCRNYGVPLNIPECDGGTTFDIHLGKRLGQRGITMNVVICTEAIPSVKISASTLN